MSATQSPQHDWYFQWEHYSDDSLWLFKEWIYPHTLDMFRGKTVVDCGCGGGQHTSFIAPYARKVIAIDLNTIPLARERNAQYNNISFVEGDLARVSLEEPADIAFCIGVIQHTVDPDKTFSNIKHFVKPEGKLLVWCYAREGNWPNWLILEPLKRWFLLKLPKSVLARLATLFTAIVYWVVYTVYLLPLRFLPYYEYFENWRKLPFQRNLLNVFDKLNAPMTHFISRAQVEAWFNPHEFSDVYLDHYKGVSWRASGVKKTLEPPS